MDSPYALFQLLWITLLVDRYIKDMYATAL